MAARKPRAPRAPRAARASESEAAERPRSATVRATRDARPARPKMDRGEEFDQLVRAMFKPSVAKFCADVFKDTPEEKPTKDQEAEVVDNLTAQYTMALQTLVDAQVTSYLSTWGADDEEEDTDEVECPECKHVFDLDEETAAQADEAEEKGESIEVECPKCHDMFELAADEDDPDEVLEAELVDDG